MPEFDGLAWRRVAVVLFAILALLRVGPASCAETRGIEGSWITFDAETRSARSIVQIAREGNHVTGRIVELYPKEGEDPDPECNLCRGPERGRKLRGLPILNLVADADGVHFNGTVLDPENGMTYRCEATLGPGGQRLELHGYVGLPIFGRSELWSRTP
jgi:uncharacterized protein (DUF2147 family)